MVGFNKSKEDFIWFRAVVNLAAKKEESSDDDSSNKDDKPAPKKVAEKKGSKPAAQTEENSSDKSSNEDDEPTPKKKKLLQNLPKRIVLAAMTVKVQIRKSLLLKNLKRPPHQNLWRKMSL